MPRRQELAAALTTVYARPDVPPPSAFGGCGKLPGPRWYWALLGAGWVGTAALAGIVLWLLQRQGGSGPVLSQGTGVPASTCSWETCLSNTSLRDIPEFKCSLNCFQLQLRERLCERGSQRAAGWQPFATKCYWISTKTKAWEAAGADCAHQRSWLVVLESAEEKGFVGQMIGNTSRAWTGLSINEMSGEEWTWWDGSPLQEALSPVLGPVKADACAAIRRGQLSSHTCSTPLRWVCQQKATAI